MEAELVRDALNKRGSPAADGSDVFVVGVDEAGRGPLAGPVTVAAMCIKLPGALLKQPYVLHGALNDSKLLTESAREVLFKHFCGLLPDTKALDGFAVGSRVMQRASETVTGCTDTAPEVVGAAVVFVDREEIDKLNILQASLTGMERAVRVVLDVANAGSEVCSSSNTVLLFDGNHLPGLWKPAKQPKPQKRGKRKREELAAAPPAEPAEEGQALPAGGPIAAENPLRLLSAVAVVKGDRRCPSIAGASVLAKVCRDHQMSEILAKDYPQYEFDVHKGYPTPRHLQLLAAHGPCPQHRLSYGPVKVALEKLAKGKRTAAAKKKESRKAKPAASGKAAQKSTVAKKKAAASKSKSLK